MAASMTTTVGTVHGGILARLGSPKYWDYSCRRYPDPQRDLKIRSPSTIWEMIYGLYRGHNGFIQGI